MSGKYGDDLDATCMLQIFYHGQWVNWWNSPVAETMIQSMGGPEQVIRSNRTGVGIIGEPMRVLRMTYEVAAQDGEP